MSFGERLKKLRIAHKLTQEELANKLSLSKSNISKYESNDVEPNFDTLRAIANLFEVSISYLVEGIETTTDSKKTYNELTEKDERDIAKRMKKMREDLQNAEGLMYSGEPLSEEALESLLEAMEYAERTTTKINKKYIPHSKRKKDSKKDRGNND